jgi:formate dehydrogenase major subunit
LLTLTINDIKISVEKDIKILEACSFAGIDIPTFCHDERLCASGACRICLVEVIGASKLAASCTTPVQDGMVIYTHSERVVRARRDILELMWASHDNDCMSCSKAGACKLQNYCYEYDIESNSRVYTKTLTGFRDKSNDFYHFNRDKCILCGKCVAVCSVLQGTGAICFSDRGVETKISHPFDAGMAHSNCVSCGNCVSVCPTGALNEHTKSKFRNWEIDKVVKTTCTYCGVGCQIELNIKDDMIVRIDPSDKGVNDGLLCVKGKFAFNFVNHPARLKTPLIRKEGVLVEASWDEALELIVAKMKQIKEESGPDAMAALSSARCSTEDNYVLQKLFRGVVGTNNVDHCARL